MAQARRVKTEPSVVRINIIRFFKWLLREASFWLLAVIALGMIVSLATFNSAAPAWTHTVEVAKLHNLGGVAGAWFADIMLYLLGYPAYLLPLGLVFAGWRLFKQGALSKLDAEVVLFRLLGLAVALTTACALASLHLPVFANTVPGDGGAGGLVGMHVGQFLIQAFGFAGGNLFMIALLLAGATLMTGVPWMTMVDWMGKLAFWILDVIGGMAMAPLRWITGSGNGTQGKQPAESGKEKGVVESNGKGAKDPSGAANAAKSGSSTRVLLTKWPPTLTGWMSGAAEKIRYWRRARHTEDEIVDMLDAPLVATEGAAALALKPESANAASATGADGTVVAGGSRHSMRIEPVFNPPMESAATLRPAAFAPPAQAVDGPISDLTLVPVPSRMIPSPPQAMPPPSNAESWTSEAFTEKRPSVVPVAKMTRELATPPRSTGSFPLPPIDLLDPLSSHATGSGDERLDEMSRQLENLLKSFGIEVRVVAVEPGPVITRFEIEPAPGVKVSQISNLAKDLARGLSVTSVRVVEIIPGKSYIGLEIPNRKRQIVFLRETLESLAYAQSTAPLTLVLGQDIGGNPVVANLNKMPHLLVAGTTGSGKSVAINTMLLSLLYKSPPSDVRLILVDPKMLELSIYEDIPHLLTPVVTDMKEAANALRWCVAEMERRYRLMAALKVRNIAGFNRKVEDALAAGKGLADPFCTPDSAETPGEVALLQPLPFIVVVIDELADMMMIVGKKVEELIARLAQKARAAGIHLILATQRPSVDVITGLIKANIPTRIAFQVSSRVDSRTILDQMGAEQLLGHGDMLYLPPGAGLPQRVHGAFVDDHEVHRVVDYLRQVGAPNYVDEVLIEPCEDSGNGIGGYEDDARGGESDPLYDEAVQIVVESRRASVSGVQRRLRIGYNRAARLVEEMEIAGIVSPVQTNGGREVLAPPPP